MARRRSSRDGRGPNHQPAAEDVRPLTWPRTPVPPRVPGCRLSSRPFPPRPACRAAACPQDHSLLAPRAGLPPVLKTSPPRPAAGLPPVLKTSPPRPAAGLPPVLKTSPPRPLPGRHLSSRPVLIAPRSGAPPVLKTIPSAPRLDLRPLSARPFAAPLWAPPVLETIPPLRLPSRPCPRDHPARPARRPSSRAACPRDHLALPARRCREFSPVPKAIPLPASDSASPPVLVDRRPRTARGPLARPPRSPEFLRIRPPGAALTSAAR
jgi:hypothetical protein